MKNRKEYFGINKTNKKYIHDRLRTDSEGKGFTDVFLVGIDYLEKENNFCVVVKHQDDIIKIISGDEAKKLYYQLGGVHDKDTKD